MNLPNPCEMCAPFGGNWRETEKGMARCVCERGKALLVKPAQQGCFTPKISAEAAGQAARGLMAIPFFPADEVAQTMIAAELMNICESTESARWLVARMIQLYRKWPGSPEMRLVYCSRHMPADGVSSTIESEVYRDGIPSEKPPAQLALPAPRSREISASPSLQRAVAMLADAKGLEAPRKRVATPEIPVVRLTAANSVTQADIDAAVSANRDARAKAELGEGC